MLDSTVVCRRALGCEWGEEVGGHVAAMTCPSPPSRGAARIYLRQVGSRTGVVAELPSAWNELVRLAETKMGFVPLRFFLATGDELDEDGLDLVRSNEVIYVSGGGEDRESLGDSPATDPTSDATSEALATLHSQPEQRHRTVIALANLSHHLQRERGTSCTWLASGRSKPSFKTLLVDIRPEVDTALREVVRPEAQQWFDKIVALIAAERHAVDAAPDSIAGRTGALPPPSLPPPPGFGEVLAKLAVSAPPHPPPPTPPTPTPTALHHTTECSRFFAGCERSARVTAALPREARTNQR